jgi:hypothetical protein
VLTKDNIVGKRYDFEDGNSIEVVQVKSRSDEYHLVARAESFLSFKTEDECER